MIEATVSSLKEYVAKVRLKKMSDDLSGEWELNPTNALNPRHLSDISTISLLNLEELAQC